MSPAPIATSDFRPDSIHALDKASYVMRKLRNILLDEVRNADDDNDLAHQAEVLRIASEVDRFVKWLDTRYE